MLDVSSGVDFYGPEGPYQLMAGKDASYAFAMMSLKAEDAMRIWLARRHGHTPWLARAWHRRGAGVARAWHVRGAGVARAWRGRGTGVARAWHGRGVGVAWAGHGLCGGRARGSCWARAPPWGRMTALGGLRPLPRVEPPRKPPRKPDHGQTGKAGAGGLIWHRAN